MITFTYLEALPLTAQEKTRITERGFDSPAALLGALRAAPGEFFKWLGRRDETKLSESLWDMLGADERRAYIRPVEKHGTGALPPKNKKPASRTVRKR